MNRLPGLGLALLALLASCGERPRVTTNFTVTPAVVVADGATPVTVLLRMSRAVSLRDVNVVLHGPGRLTSINALDGRTMQLSYLPSINPGAAQLSVRGTNMAPASLELNAVPTWRDSFGDGTADILRLTALDRDSFRQWFTLLAERQAVLPAGNREREVTDCAALLRYAYREALRRHDSVWFRTTSLEGLRVPPEIEKYEYPHTPLGANLFRVRPGSFRAEDLENGSFAEFGDAKTLQTLNTYFVSRDLRRAEPGDLLFFRQSEQRSPFHSMIYVGPSHFERGGRWIVYHTGPDGRHEGEMRRVTDDELRRHPDRRWQPVISNPNFLGVFRWNILREAN